MKNYILSRSFVFCILALFCSQAVRGELLRWSDGSIVDGSVLAPSRTVEKVGSDIIVTYEFGEYGVANPPDSAGYLLSMPEFTACATAGKPSYLFKKDLLNVPDPEGVTVEVIEADYKDFSLRLAAAQPLQLMTDPEPPTPSPISAYSGFYPATPLNDIEAFPFKGNGVVEIVVRSHFAKRDLFVLFRS